MHEKLGPSQEIAGTGKVLLVEFADPTFAPFHMQEDLLKEKGLGYIGTTYDRNLCPRRMIVSGTTSPEDLAKLGYTKIQAVPEEVVFVGLP